MAEDDQFELRLGRIRGRGRGNAARPLQSGLIGRLNRSGMHPAKLGTGPGGPGHRRRNGRFNARGRGASVGAVAARASPWSVDAAGMRVRARRVVVKARVVKLAGARAAASARAHLRYLQRDGVTREGEPGPLYSTFSEEADGKAFLERCEGDRHQFRFIVSPEDGVSFDSLRSFTRELMAKMEADLATNLDWVAADHFDTGHPHSHILVRGVTEDGKVLNIAGDYIAHGVRGRASEIMTRWLGPQTELEVRAQMARDVDAERLTPLDRTLLSRAVEGRVDLASGAADWDRDGGYQQLLISRARRLERMELATREAPRVWRLAVDTERILADLGRRGDIIRTLHLAMTEAKLDRRPELYVADAPDPDAPAIVGRIVARGAADDHHERRYLVIDGVDGRTHYADIGRSDQPAPVGGLVALRPVLPMARPADRNIAAVALANGGNYSIDLHLAHDPAASEEFARAHVRRLEAIRRSVGGVERRPDGSWTIPVDFPATALEHERGRRLASPYRIDMLSTLDLEAQAVADAPTWLDRQLEGGVVEVAAHGFGGEMRQALQRRRLWLIEQGLAERRGDAVILASGLAARLERRELDRIAARLGRELGRDHVAPSAGDRISGILKRRVDIASGSYGLVENERAFALVPWRPVLQRRIGQSVSGVMRGSGAISWSFGRERAGPDIAM